MDAKAVFEQFQDHLAPKLDTYEQAIYLYIFRHSRLQGQEEVTIGFKSVRKRMAFGVGAKGTPMAQGTCYEKLQSLASKGCVRVLDSVREGKRVRVLLPSEIPGVIKQEQPAPAPALEEVDFFSVAENGPLILKREGNKCFYCLRSLDDSNYVIEHVVSRPHGNNSYRNVVAACRECNNRKGDTVAEDFIRGLYRNGYLRADEMEGGLSRLRLLAEGRLKPSLA